MASILNSQFLIATLKISTNLFAKIVLNASLAFPKKKYIFLIPCHRALQGDNVELVLL
jgi:hypothetical protein